MKFASYILISLLTLVLFAGCATIKGNNIAEQKEYVHDMKAETLVRLYGEYPIAKEQIKKILPDTVSLAISILIYFS